MIKGNQKIFKKKGFGRAIPTDDFFLNDLFHLQGNSESRSLLLHSSQGWTAVLRLDHEAARFRIFHMLEQGDAGSWMNLDAGS